MKKIPAGYLFAITTWENDADNYCTKSLSGLSEGAVQFLVEFVELFYSKNTSRDGKTYFGNMYEPSQEEIDKCYAAVQAVIDKHAGKFTDEQILKHLDSHDGIRDLMFELELASEFWSRVLSDFEVQFFKEDIIIQDVTALFNRM